MELHNDVHVHWDATQTGQVNAKELLAAMDKAGIEKMALLSCYGDTVWEQEQNVRDVAKVTAEAPDRLYGMAWIEPKHNTPLDFLQKAVSDWKIRGFKMIPNTWYPYEEWLFPYYATIADLQVPCLFHSGILHLGTLSSRCCRPVFYEALLGIPRFRFALAHISWPWTDECIAFFGQWRAAQSRGETTSEMFVDTTPGTPPGYREDALRKLTEFGGADHALYGTDAHATEERLTLSAEQAVRDREIYGKLGLSEEAIKGILSGNFDKFFLRGE